MLQILHDEPLQALNSLRLKAKARALVCADNTETLARALEYAQAHQVRVIPLGEGSNVVLVGDLEALILRYTGNDIRVLEQSDSQARVSVAAGHNWHAFVEWCLGQGYFGLENLALIPGAIGAAPIQNIGAYGVEVKDFISAVEGVHLTDASPFRLNNPECEFGYRDSVFKRDLRDKVLITRVEFELPRRHAPRLDYPDLQRWFENAPAPTARAVFDAVVSIRKSKLPDPAQIPNAGSFFKNPVVDQQMLDSLRPKHPELPAFAAENKQWKLSAGWLIDQCGFKGCTSNGVGVDDRHALVLVNRGGDSGRELLKLAGSIQSAVHDRFGLALEIEPRVYGA